MLVGIGVVTGFALFTIPETLPAARRNAEPLTAAFASYAALLRDRTLLGYACAGGFFYGGIFAYVAGTPFAYITFYHVPAQTYGLLFGLGSLGIMGANFWNARVVRRAGSDQLLRSGAAAALLAALVLALDARTGLAGLWGLVVPLFVFVGASGFIVANAVVGALGVYPGRVGTVSAFVGAIQYGSGMAGSALVGAFANGTPWPLGCVVALCGIGTFLGTLLVPWRARHAPEEALT
jgi:DHA1 family bicyclomycin/chloramphenicol resistance-like MFS transporter